MKMIFNRFVILYLLGLSIYGCIESNTSRVFYESLESINELNDKLIEKHRDLDSKNSTGDLIK